VPALLEFLESRSGADYMRLRGLVLESREPRATGEVTEPGTDAKPRTEYGPPIRTRSVLDDKVSEWALSPRAHFAIAAAATQQGDRWVHIPIEIDHSFRSKPITSSDPSRSVIPAEADHWRAR
jgi:hypothetical protein